jgi:hypothetical protein
MKTLAIFLSTLLLSYTLFINANAQLLGGNQKESCAMGNENLNVTSNYYRNGGKLDVFVTYPDKPTNDQIVVEDLTAYVYEGNNLLKKYAKNNDTTLVAGGKQVYIQQSGIYPKNSRTNLDIVVKGELKDSRGLGLGGRDMACGSASVRTE